MHSHRRRFGIGRIRKATTDRPPLTNDSWDAVNKWRRELLEIQSSPAAYGIGFQGVVPDDMVIGVDETPLHYVPNSFGTYVSAAEDAVYINGMLQVHNRSSHPILSTGEADKRQATATPCTSKSGELVACQLIWRGKTTMCLPHLSEAQRIRAKDLHVYCEFAEKKCQTGRTWKTLLNTLARYAANRYAWFLSPQSPLSNLFPGFNRRPGCLAHHALW